MKITLEQASLPETEVILKGNIAGPEIAAILQLLNSKVQTRKLMVAREDEQFVLDADEIVYLETGGTKVNVYTKTEQYESRMKLYELKELLSSSPFAQISKSTLVNINYVKSIQAEFSGNYRVKLKGRSEILTISRKYFPEFHSHI